jgi:hypothetical protein
MLAFFSDRPGFGLGAAAGLLLAVAAAGGYFFGRSGDAPQLLWPERAVRGDSSAIGQQFAICTGAIEQEEGLCTLDFLTGDMIISVLNRRTGKWGGIFKGNVLTELTPEKGKPSKYLLCSGQVAFQRALAGGGNVMPARGCFYVLDENTGRFAAYTVFWNATLAASGQPQAGQIQPVDVGIARAAPVRRD